MAETVAPKAALRVFHPITPDDRKPHKSVIKEEQEEISLNRLEAELDQEALAAAVQTAPEAARANEDLNKVLLTYDQQKYLEHMKSRNNILSGPYSLLRALDESCLPKLSTSQLKEEAQKYSASPMEFHHHLLNNAGFGSWSSIKTLEAKELVHRSKRTGPHHQDEYQLTPQGRRFVRDLLASDRDQPKTLPPKGDDKTTSSKSVVSSKRKRPSGGGLDDHTQRQMAGSLLGWLSTTITPNDKWRAPSWGGYRPVPRLLPPRKRQKQPARKKKKQRECHR